MRERERERPSSTISINQSVNIVLIGINRLKVPGNTAAARTVKWHRIQQRRKIISKKVKRIA